MKETHVFDLKPETLSLVKASRYNSTNDMREVAGLLTLDLA
jgi:hypothetical protein